MHTIAEILLVTAQQKIAQRETGRSFRVKDIKRKSLTFGQSCGNFLAILSVVARHDSVIAERIQYSPANAKYIHHTIHNALLDIMKDMTLEQIQEEVRKAVYFTVLANELKILAKRNRLSLQCGTVLITVSMKNLLELPKHKVWMQTVLLIPLSAS